MHVGWVRLTKMNLNPGVTEEVPPAHMHMVQTAQWCDFTIDFCHMVIMANCQASNTNSNCI